MRKKILVVLAVSAGVIGALAVSLFLIDVNQFRPQIEARLQQVLKRPVKLGAMSLKIFPLSLRVQDFSAGALPEFDTGRPFITAKEIEVHAALLPLLRKDVRIQSLVLLQPAVELIRNKQGVWNYSNLTQTQGGSDGSLELSNIEISDGRIGVTDLKTGGARTAYEHIDLTLDGYKPGHRFQVEASLRLPGEGRLELKGSGGPLPATNLNGKLSLSNASLASLQTLAGSKLDVEAILSGTADVKTEGDKTTIQGTLKATGVRYEDIKLPQPVDVEYQAVRNEKSDTLDVPVLKASSGETTLTAKLSRSTAGMSGSGTLRNLAVPVSAINDSVMVKTAQFQLSPGIVKLTDVAASLKGTNARAAATIQNFAAPDVQFNLNVDKVDLGEFEKLASQAPAPPKGKSGGMNKVTGAGTINAGTLKYNNLVLTKVTAQCTLDRGLIRLAPIEGTSSGGKVTGSIQADTRGAVPRMTVATKLERVDANQLLSSTTSLKDVLTGLFSGAMQTSFTAKPGEPITKSLNGTVNILLTDARWQRANLMSEVSNIGRFLNSGATKGEGFTRIQRLAGSLNIRNGLAQTDDLKLELEGGSVAAAGLINLVDQTLNLRLNAVLKKALSQQVGGSQVGGFMTTALANPQGELVIPVIVTGTLAQPRFAPDAQRFTQMKLKSLIPSTGNPGAGVKGLVDAIRGGQATTGEQQEKRPAGSLLDLLRNRKDKPPPK